MKLDGPISNQWNCFSKRKTPRAGSPVPNKSYKTNKSVHMTPVLGIY